MRTCACVASHRKSITKRCESAMQRSKARTTRMLVPLPSGSGNRSGYASVGAGGCNVRRAEGRRRASLSGNGRKWEWPDRDKAHMLGT